MCGIVGVFDLKVNHMELRATVLKMSKKVRHRGPDWSGIFYCEKAILAHERLSIVDPQSGKQPLYSKDGNLILAVNGEIYNHQEIRKRYEKTWEFQTHSDCEVILPLYQDKGPAFIEELNGIMRLARANGVNWGIGHGHVDFAGSSVVHMQGGVIALIFCWLIGPRHGKYDARARS